MTERRRVQKQMMSKEIERLAAVAFGLDVIGDVGAVGAGNINSTAVVQTEQGNFVLQDLNPSVFVDPVALMANVELIIAEMSSHNLPAIELRRTVEGGVLAFFDDVPWRCYRFIDGESTPPITTTEEAQATARAFGRYAKAIEGLALSEHMAGYHDFSMRVDAFDGAVADDSADRLAGCIGQVEDLQALVSRLRLTSAYEKWLELPVRNAHNDAKGPNCIIGTTGRTIIDLDTTMPSTLLADIGELVRSSTRDLENAGPEVLMAQIASVNRGFLAGYGDAMTSIERDCMLLAGPLMTVENAVRFLADHLSGDTYYGATTPNQNLDRATAQLNLAQRLVEAIELATSGSLTNN